jgi:hypothetical protein
VWRKGAAGNHRPERRRQDHLLQSSAVSFPPSAGTIEFDGRDITALAHERVASAWPAHFRSRDLPELNVFENVDQHW